jgi:hypothetical protein
LEVALEWGLLVPAAAGLRGRKTRNRAGQPERKTNMSVDAERQQQKVREFMSLLPLTLELAGLPRSDHGKYYTEEQIAARAITVRHAYKVARQTIAEIASS